VIVRILGEGQYRLDDRAFATADAIDDRVQAAADAGDETAFAAALAELVEAVRRLGAPVALDELEGSDAIVPADGTTLAEARELLSSEGLLPG
jgi:PspA-Associated protein